MYDKRHIKVKSVESKPAWNANFIQFNSILTNYLHRAQTTLTKISGKQLNIKDYILFSFV